MPISQADFALILEFVFLATVRVFHVKKVTLKF